MKMKIRHLFGVSVHVSLPPQLKVKKPQMSERKRVLAEEVLRHHI
jgi:hypothetical protein